MAASLSRDAAKLASFAEAFRVLSDAMPARGTTRQTLAILRVISANAAGKSVTMSDLRDFTPEEGSGPSIGVSIARSFSIFYEPSKHNPDGLGWVVQEPDLDDGRVKYLRLTPKGMEIARKVAAQLG